MVGEFALALASLVVSALVGVLQVVNLQAESSFESAWASSGQISGVVAEAALAALEEVALIMTGMVSFPPCVSPLAVIPLRLGDTTVVSTTPVSAWTDLPLPLHSAAGLPLFHRLARQGATESH